MERFVVSQAMQTVAVLWKRGWGVDNEDRFGDEEKKKWLMELGGLAVSKDYSGRILCARMLQTMVEEFCARNTSTRIDLPLAFHKRAKEAFQENGLLESLSGGMLLLRSAMNDMREGISNSNTTTGLTTDMIVLVSSAVQLVSSILSWEFHFQEVWQQHDSSPLITPDPTWRPYIICPDLISAIFDVYSFCRLLTRQHAGWSNNLYNLLHNLQQLIIQFCSIHGDIFEGTGERRAYVCFLLDRLSVLFAATTIGSNDGSTDRVVVASSSFHSDALATTDKEQGRVSERIALALAARNLFINLGLKELSELQGFVTFISRLSTLTISVVAAVSHSACNGSDVSLNWHMETFSELLLCWGFMVSDDAMLKLKLKSKMNNPEDYESADKLRSGLSLVILPVYESYVQARQLISRVECARAISSEEDGDVNECEAADIDEELCQVAALGRLAVSGSGGSLEVTIRSLASVQEAVVNLISTGMIENLPGVDPTTGCLIAAASAVLEEARVCYLMAGHLLADDDDNGDIPLIPESLMEPLSTDPQAAQYVVTLLQMITGHLQWCTQRLLSGQNLLLLSPSLVQALLWCCARISSTYLLPDTESYISKGEIGYGGGGGNLAENKWKISSILTNYCFQKGESAASLTNLLLCSSWTFLQNWSSEPDVCSGALALLNTLVKPSTAPTVVSLPFWSGVADAAATGKLSRLPNEMQGSILSAIIRGTTLSCGALGMSPSSPRENFLKLTLPVSTKLQDEAVAIANNPHDMIGGKSLHDLELYLELARGTVKGTDGSRHSSEIGDFVEAVIRPVIIILHMVSNPLIDCETLVLGCLTLLRDIADVQLLFMDPRRSQLLCGASLETITVYSNSTNSRRQQQKVSQIQNCHATVSESSTHFKSYAEESYFTEMVVLYELLSHLILKDTINLSSTTSSADNNPVTYGDGGGGHIIYSSVPDTVLFGLSRLLPLMNDAMLAFPPLASQYFSFVGYMCDMYPERLLVNLKGDVISKLWSSIMFGATQESLSVARSSIGAMGGLASHQQSLIGNHEPSPILNSSSTVEAIAILLKLLAEDGPIWDRIDTVADTLLSLALCNATGMESVTYALVKSQPAEHHQQLNTAFFQLMSHIDVREGSVSRRNVQTFRRNLRAFVITLRGLLVCR